MSTSVGSITGLLLLNPIKVIDKKTIENAMLVTILITQIALKTIKALEENKLYEFDPLAGDTACQIRASKVLDLFEKLKNDKSFKEELAKTKTQLNEVNQNIKEILQKEQTKMNKLTDKLVNRLKQEKFKLEKIIKKPDLEESERKKTEERLKEISEALSKLEKGVQFEKKIGYSPLDKLKQEKVKLEKLKEKPDLEESEREKLEKRLKEISDDLPKLEKEEEIEKQIGYKPFQNLIPTARNSSFYKFRCNNKLEFEVSQDLKFLIESYFLTYFKKSDEKFRDIGDYEKLEKEFSLKSVAAKANFTFFQRNLTLESVKYVQNLAAFLEDESLKTLVGKEAVFVDSFVRSGIPCYFGMKILLLSMLKKDRTIILKIFDKSSKRGLIDRTKSTSLVFKANKEKTDFVQVSGEIDIRENAFVIEGFKEDFKGTERETIQKINEIGLIKILLSNDAAHAQYFTEQDEDPFKRFKENESVSSELAEFETLKKFANENGCTSNKPTLFCIEHIYANNIGNSLGANI
ncbi:MAG: hypothetical protein KR126chlam6_00547 [Candidatus Anoxychlamydiales bacterium]|nr:hypothetical protein [Candidatus Anoxychlamydiales bacterium]